MYFFGSVVRVSAVTTGPAFAYFHGHRVPAVLVALFTKVRFATAEKSGNVAAKEAFECYVLVAVRLACGWEVLIAVQAIDALPRPRLLFACSRALVFASVARFIAISV
jgi:hypothetical protein